MPAKAYSYLRFSTSEQIKGDSLRRQTALAEDWARRHGLELDEELTFHDLGVSGYRGANAETGQLGAFLEAVKLGAIPQGSYLLVESLDRLSRDKARKAVRVLEDICEQGITLVTLTDGRVYTSESLSDDPMSFMWAFMVAIRANEESAMKARRLKAAWGAKRSRAAERPLTAKAPSWLRLADDRSAFHVIEERAAAVRRVYQLTLDGMGMQRIAETLNEEGVPCLGGAKYWQRSTIFKLLESPAVVGTFVPHVLEHVNGRKVRRPQEPVEGYYPAVVDEETYLRVRSMRSGGRAPVARNGRELANILSGLARCPLCGDSMRRVNKGSGPKGGRPKLVCSRAKDGAGCRYRSVDYPEVVDALVEGAELLAGTAPSGDASVDDALDDLYRERDLVDVQINNIIDGIAHGPSAALSERLRKAEDERDRLDQRIRDTIQKVNEASGPLLEHKLAGFKEAFRVQEGETLNAARANAALRQLFTEVIVDYRSGQLALAWKHGGGSSSVIFGWPDDDPHPD